MEVKKYNSFIDIKIKLNPDIIIKNIPTDEELSDNGIMESIYIIRKLKALSKSQENGYIICDELNNDSALSNEYDIWFYKDEFIVL